MKARPGGCRDFCFDIVIRECYSVIAGGGDFCCLVNAETLEIEILGEFRRKEGTVLL